jgi:hypothetical protein
MDANNVNAQGDITLLAFRIFNLVWVVVQVD